MSVTDRPGFDAKYRLIIYNKVWLRLEVVATGAILIPTEVSLTWEGVDKDFAGVCWVRFSMPNCPLTFYGVVVGFDNVEDNGK